MTEADAFAAFAAVFILAHVIGAAIVICIRQHRYPRRVFGLGRLWSRGTDA